MVGETTSLNRTDRSLPAGGEAGVSELWTIATLVVVAIQLLSCGTSPVPADRTENAVLSQRIERLVARYVEIGDFSGVVFVARGDNVMFAGAFGEPSRESGAPNSMETAS